ncbi:TenA family transcriptional regulator [Grimontia hollisae]|uniref:TenA family transcriptional regulator n=1 Tax=Grimontia hollisae TaxID=673 RepID=UPI0013039A2F|nr:iron-containing redox enzyme family protein [Grimontia hollisae]
MTQGQFFKQLELQTRDAREAMLQAPIFDASRQGHVSKNTYTAFLVQAYHHVKHTVPLLMACGARLPEKYEWLRQDIGEYIEEEKGHHEWILSDLKQCGFDAGLARSNTGEGAVGLPIEMMVAYLYHQIDRRNPMAFFGMVWVLEGTSVTVGGDMAVRVKSLLGLPDSAMTYLTSHSTLDVEHIGFFETLMNKITDPDDQAAIVDSANRVFALYGQMLRELPIQQNVRAA